MSGPLRQQKVAPDRPPRSHFVADRPSIPPRGFSAALKFAVLALPSPALARARRAPRRQSPIVPPHDRIHGTAAPAVALGPRRFARAPAPRGGHPPGRRARSHPDPRPPSRTPPRDLGTAPPRRAHRSRLRAGPPLGLLRRGRDRPMVGSAPASEAVRF